MHGKTPISDFSGIAMVFKRSHVGMEDPKKKKIVKSPVTLRTNENMIVIMRYVCSW